MTYRDQVKYGVCKKNQIPTTKATEKVVIQVLNGDAIVEYKIELTPVFYLETYKQWHKRHGTYTEVKIDDYANHHNLFSVVENGSISIGLAPLPDAEDDAAYEEWDTAMKEFENNANAAAIQYDYHRNSYRNIKILSNQALVSVRKMVRLRGYVNVQSQIMSKLLQTLTSIQEELERL